MISETEIVKKFFERCKTDFVISNKFYFNHITFQCHTLQLWMILKEI